MANEIIRVPRTTAAFIIGLGRILREELGYPAYIEECWTFEHTAQWEACGRRGRCTIHGTDQCDETGHYDECQCSLPCYEYRHDIYMGKGFFHSKGRVEVCCRISVTHWDAGGDLIDVELWLQDERSPVRALRFSVRSSGNFWADTKKSPAPLPPNRFAFWKDHPGVKTKRRSRQTNRLRFLLKSLKIDQKSAATPEDLQELLTLGLQS